MHLHRGAEPGIRNLGQGRAGWLKSSCNEKQMPADRAEDSYRTNDDSKDG